MAKRITRTSGIPTCPHCELLPECFKDMAGLFVISCNRCGMTTAQHTTKLAASRDWRRHVNNAKRHEAKP